MNTIRALNVRTRSEGQPGRKPDPQPVGDRPSSYIAPLPPARQPAPDAAGPASDSKLPVIPA
jgi:hypothetical protein